MDLIWINTRTGQVTPQPEGPLLEDLLNDSDCVLVEYKTQLGHFRFTDDHRLVQALKSVPITPDTPRA